MSFAFLFAARLAPTSATGPRASLVSYIFDKFNQIKQAIVFDGRDEEIFQMIVFESKHWNQNELTC